MPKSSARPEAATVRDLAATVLRLMAVWMLLQAALSLSHVILGSVQSLTRSGFQDHLFWIWAYLIMAAAQAAVGVVLLIRAQPIAARIAPATTMPQVALSSDGLMNAGFALLAMFLVYEALPGIANVYIAVAAPAATWLGSEQLRPSAGPEALRVGIRLAFAALLWWRGVVAVRRTEDETTDEESGRSSDEAEQVADGES